MNDVCRIRCERFWTPDSDALRFLPEGPQACPDGRVSWVAIQHGPRGVTGSVNLFDPTTRQNETFEVPGRPGFAFPTTSPGVFLVGADRTVGLLNISDGTWTECLNGIDADVSDTIINDACFHDDFIVFGCKDLHFQTAKAGLYLWTVGTERPVRLRQNCICSNGKFVVQDEEGLLLYDIDSPRKTITCSRLDIEQGTVSDERIIVDLTAEDVFPDGMIPTPDGRSLIVAIYNPHDAPAGQARQYHLETGDLECVWECPGAAQVTCPLLVQIDGQVRLLLTTAVEHLPDERLPHQPAAGSLFIGDTAFDSAGSDRLPDVEKAGGYNPAM